MASFKNLFTRSVRMPSSTVRTLSRTHLPRVLRWEQLEDRTVPAPAVLDPNLKINTVASGLSSPIGMAFLASNDFLFLEKNTGQVKRVVNGAIQATPVLDLAVNFASERGLLSIALHPDFKANPSVYLYWTESSTGADTDVLSETSLLGNRVDRFVWNGAALTQAENITSIRAIQQDATNPVERGNHDGGVIKFGPDGKLYVFVGDVGRRGQMQNLENGPFSPGDPQFGTDDQFGGPEPDDAHLTGVILRLNPDGTIPADNPFADVSGVSENIRQIFSYGHRNGFGMAFDPVSGSLWAQENGDDSFSELNRIEPGMNGGWVQIMGPVSRIAQFKQIETGNAPGFPAGTFKGLQQVRWSPDNIADTPAEALERLVVLPGSHYSDPEFSWKFEVAPGGVGFMTSRALGPQYKNDLFMGAATPALEGGYLFHFNLTGNRRKVAVDDPRLADRVADNVDKHDLTESGSLLFGTGFGVVTDILTGPAGNLFVVSLLDPTTGKGAIYEIARKNADLDAPPPFAAVGADTGGGPHVKVFDNEGKLMRSFFAFDPAFRGGVRVAIGEVNDDMADIVTAAGPGGGPHIKVFDGIDNRQIFNFFAYDDRFRGGLNVAVGDVNADGFADIVTAPDAGGGPHVKVFSGVDGTLIRSFFAYENSFRGGVRVAVGDVNSDGYADIVTAGGALVKVFDGATGNLLTSFSAGESSKRGSVFVAVGDLDGDALAEIVVGAAPGTSPRVQTFNGVNGDPIASFLAYDEKFRGGVRVAVNDIDNDGMGKIVTGPGIGGGPDVRLRDCTFSLERCFFAFDQQFRGGVFVG